MVLGALAALLALAFVLAIASGPSSLPIARLLELLLDPAAASDTERAVVGSIRLPRALLAVLVGAVLGTGGAASQGLFRNPLADPGLVGVSAGGALGAALAIVVGSAFWHEAPEAWRSVLLPAGAFAGSLLTTAFVARLGSPGGRPQVVAMLLAGVAVSAFAGSLIGALGYFADDAQLRNLSFWLLGGLGHATWRTVLGALPFAVVALALLGTLGSSLDRLALGEREALYAGVDVPRVQRRVVVALALGVGGMVAAAGPIGFVGLVVPHAARLLTGPRHAAVLPVSAALGATLVVLADVAARLVVRPLELPLGVLTALLGAPFFLVLLRREVHP